MVNRAGITTALPIKNIKPEKLNFFINTNVVAAINLIKQLIKPDYINKDGVSIVLIASVKGIVGEIGKTIYSITKGALLSGSKSMALELSQRKIRVNCISPGVVITPILDRAVFSQNDETRKRIIDLHPLGLGNPVDIAHACIFLLSDASRWITGSNLVIDGGYSAR